MNKIYKNAIQMVRNLINIDINHILPKNTIIFSPLLMDKRKTRIIDKENNRKIVLKKQIIK